MTGAERLRLAIEGKRPDKVPLFLVHDERYGIKALGKTMRDFLTADPEEMTRMSVNNFNMHPCDGFMSEIMYNFNFHELNVLEDIQGEFYVFRVKDTGELFKMNSGGESFTMNGRALHDHPDSVDPLITCREDIARLVPKAPPRGFDGEFGYFAPARILTSQNPGHHIATEITSPFVRAVWRCGGYEAGLCLLMDDPDLMVELMQAEMELELQRLPAMVASGVKSSYFTSFFTGPDTISPKAYRTIVKPMETEEMSRIHEAGLWVIYWFLGNTHGLLEDFAAMPFDVLALEQPRKGYDVSYKAVRDVLGEGRCVMSHTKEDDMIRYAPNSMRSYFDTQYNEAGRDGAFIAGVTITPENADPRALDSYVSIVDEYAYV